MLPMTCTIQDDAGGKVNSLEGDSISNSERKKVYINMCVILNGYWNVFECQDLTLLYIFCLFVGLNEKWCLQKKGSYMTQTAHSHSGCCCPHKDTWTSTENNNMNLYMRSKVQWDGQWDFQSFIVHCNIRHFCVTNFSFKHYIKNEIKWTISNFFFLLPLKLLFYL